MSNGTPKPGDVKYEKSFPMGTFIKYEYRQGEGWVKVAEVQAAEVPRGEGGTAPDQA
jgi:hypothetical protein